MRVRLTGYVVVGFLSFLFAYPPHVVVQQDTTVVAGPEYRTADLHEPLLGQGGLWTVPVRVPVLDLDAYAGGLAPMRRGGVSQTISLRFEDEDGQEYNSRSTNKEITKGLPWS